MLDAERPGFFARHVVEILADHLPGGPAGVQSTAVEPHRLVAEPLDATEVVGDEHDRLPARLELLDLADAAMLERFVADGQHLIDQQDVRVDGDRDREPKPHVHARRIGLDGVVDEGLEAGERHDLVEPRANLRAGKAEEHAVDVDVLPPGELRVEPGAQLDQRGHAPADRYLPGRGLQDPTEHLQ